LRTGRVSVSGSHGMLFRDHCTTWVVEKIEKRKEESSDCCSARSTQLSGETTRQLARKRLHVLRFAKVLEGSPFTI